MSDSLAQLIVKLQSLLSDDGALFTTAICTSAIRQALKNLNLSIPMHAADTMLAVAEQKEYELEEINALAILDVLRQGTDLYAEYGVSLAFHDYFEDDRPFFRLLTPEADGTVLIVRYLLPYVIGGLDGESDCTLPPLYDVVLLDGAAWQACVVRAAGVIESDNLNVGESASFQQMAAHFKMAFELGLARLGQRKFPVSQPDERAWNDKWFEQN
jgi:hypothetical protein